MVTIQKLDLKHAPASQILSISNAYKTVFSTDPAWNEFWKCPKCDNGFPESFLEKECFYCIKQGYSVPLVEYWSNTNILGDFYKEMAKDRAICIIALEDNINVVGFCWGYFVQVNPELEKHLEAPGLIESLREYGINGMNVAYQDEIAVIPEFQKQGIAKKLFIERHRHFYNEMPDAISIFRTLATPPSVTYKWMIEKLDYKIIHKIESQNRLRVIAAKKVSNFF